MDLREARAALEQSGDLPQSRIRRRLGRLQARRQVGDWVADVAAPVRGVPKDALVGAHLRYRRRTRRVVQTVLATLLALAVATSVTAGVAVTQLRQARHETQVATSRELAALAENLRGSHLDLAELFAVEAYRLNPSPQALAALFQSVTAGPQLVTYLQASGTVSAVAGSADGQVIVVGLSDGSVLRWSSPQAHPVTIAHLAAPVTSVSADADGSAVVALSKAGAVRWDTSAGTRPLAVPSGQISVAAGISPSGSLTAIGTAPPNPASAFQYDVTLFGEQADPLKIAAFDSAYGDKPRFISFPSDTQLVILDSSGTTWHRLSAPGLATMGSSIEPLGANEFTEALSPGGAFFSVSGGSSPLPVYPTTGDHTDLDSPPRSGLTAGADPTALAINSPGTLIAQADQGTIYVSRTASHPSAAPLRLTGNSAINEGALTFAGSDRLVSASGDLLEVWDLGQYSRIATVADIPLPPGCKACANPQVTVRPDGQEAVILSGRDDTMTVTGLPPGAKPAMISAAGTDTYGAAEWSADGRRLLLAMADGGAEIWSAGRSLTRSGQWRSSPAIVKLMGLSGGDQGSAPELLAPRAHGQQTVEVDTSGDIMVRDTETGQVDQTIRGPANLADASAAGGSFAAADAAGQVVAVLSVSGGVTVTSLVTGHHHTLPGPFGERIGFDGERLLIQQPGGALQVWNADATRLIKVIAGTPDTVVGPIAGPSGLVVETNESNSANMIDLNSGISIGTILLPTGWRVGSTGIAMPPDGTLLVTATENPAYSSSSGELTEWQMSASTWVKVACASAGHDLSAADWREYVGGTVPGDLACTGSS
jgi:WD40 repeat protein